MGLFGLGLPEVAVIAGVAVLLFGPSKIPELGKALGKTVRGLQDASQVRLHAFVSTRFNSSHSPDPLRLQSFPTTIEQEFKEELDKELAKGPEDEEGSDEVEKSGEE